MNRKYKQQNKIMNNFNSKSGFLQIVKMIQIKIIVQIKFNKKIYKISNSKINIYKHKQINYSQIILA